MLNKGFPANEIKKADLTKIKKLEEALAKLKSGEENYYVITKLKGKEVGDALRNYKSQLVNYQSDYKKIKWTTVRLIKNNDLLIIEYLIECLLTRGDYAQKLAYLATRSYVEKYNPSVGTGLIKKSIKRTINFSSFCYISSSVNIRVSLTKLVSEVKCYESATQASMIMHFSMNRKIAPNFYRVHHMI